jgi:hypothetical protein
MKPFLTEEAIKEVLDARAKINNFDLKLSTISHDARVAYGAPKSDRYRRTFLSKDGEYLIYEFPRDVYESIPVAFLLSPDTYVKSVSEPIVETPPFITLSTRYP